MSGEEANRAVRVLSIPGRRTATRYIKLFCKALDDAGVKVVDADSRDAALFRFDILHLHCPYFYIVEKSPLVAAVWFLIFAVVLGACRASGKLVVYQIHDVIPFHDRNAWLLWPFLEMVHRATDGFVFLSPSSKAEFYRRNAAQAAKPFLMLPHAPYPVRMSDPRLRQRRRSELSGGTDAFIVGYFGYRQARKGLHALAMLPERLADGRAVRLLVAGVTAPEFTTEARAILARLPASMLTLHDKRLSDEELNETLQSVDLALAPYTEGWNSGMALLILSNRVRCLCSDLPMFTDLQAEVGASWVETFSWSGNSEASFRAALDRIVASAASIAEVQVLERFLDASSFASGAVRLRGFYERLLGTSREPICV
jgi:glycosyltransferase involved in cell wall biosynthesis